MHDHVPLAGRFLDGSKNTTGQRDSLCLKQLGLRKSMQAGFYLWNISLHCFLVLHVETASLSLVNAFIITKHFADYIWKRDTTKRCLCKCLVLFCFVSLRISFRKGAVSDGYLTMNVDRYSVMPRKILTAFDFG